MRKLVAISFLTAALALGACSPGVDRTVAYSSDLVAVMLTRMSPQADLMAMAKQFPNTDFRMDHAADAVTWTYTQNGLDACRFSAKITANGAQSSHVTTALQDVSQSGERYLCNVVKIVGEESVAAALEGRAADRAKVQDQLKRYMVSDFGGMTDSISKRMTEMAPPRGDDRVRPPDRGPEPLPSGPVRPMNPLPPAR